MGQFHMKMREKIEVIIWDHFDEGEAVMDAADDIMKELLSTDMRDKIVETIQQADFEHKHTGEGPSSYALADAIMEAFTGEITHGKSQE
jgi:hypothetical protein